MKKFPRMRRHLAVVLAAAIAACGMMARVARADGPEVGVNVGAAMPLSKYKKTTSPDVGGTVGFEGGYRFDVTPEFAISLLANPQFFLYDNNKDCCGNHSGDDVASVFSITGGPRFSLLTGPVETYVGAAGGYYRDMSGQMSDDGLGFNAGGGFAFAIAPDTTLGLFGRYDYANMVAQPGSDVARQWASAGITVQHVFQNAEEPPPAPPPPPPPPPAPKRRIVLRGVNFDFDKSNIRPDARAILDEAVSTLKAEPQIRVSVEGHTDAIGSDAYNQKLSERRAEAVADYLARGGIARARLSTKGFGESEPVASNMDEDGRAQNRRVELRILDQ